jgi:hypothetical protein
MNPVDITAIRNSSSNTDSSPAAASLRYMVTSGFWSHITHSRRLPPAAALALASPPLSPLMPVAAVSKLSSAFSSFVHIMAIDDPPHFPPYARFQPNGGDEAGEGTKSRLSVARMWLEFVAAAATVASTSLRRAAAVHFPASAHAVAHAGVELLLLRRCSPVFGDVQEALAFGRGACAQWGCSWGLQLETSAWGGAAGELPGNVVDRHLWMGHVGGMHALYVQEVEKLSASTRAQLQQYGHFMSQLLLRDVPDTTCALLLPFDHAYTPYAEAAGSRNSMWHPHPPSNVISSIMEMFFPGIAPAAQWQRSWSDGDRPMADTQWGGVLDVLVQGDGDAVRRIRNDTWAKYKVLIVPSFFQQQQPMLLDDIITASQAGATIVLDAGITSGADGEHVPLLVAVTGCDFGVEGADVLVRAWVRRGVWGFGDMQASPAATSEMFLTRPCIISPVAPADGSRVEVLAHGVGAGTGREMPLLVRKWHGNNGGSVIFCTVRHMQAPAGLAGPCKEAIALAGAKAAVVSVRSGGGLLLAYSSSSSSDGSMRRVVLNNNAAAWWVGDVRVAAVDRDMGWSECVQQEGGNSQQKQQLKHETGVDGEACLQGVRVPPLGVLLISCAHTPRHPQHSE